MAVSAVNSASVNNATKIAGLSMDDMLKLLLTELTYQNPLKPVENKDFLAQMAQFSALDTSRELNDNIQKLLNTQSLNQTVGLLGRTVDTTKEDGTLLTGKVDALTIVAGEPQITIKDIDGAIFTGITMAQVRAIR